jgi:hypothetical protein
MTTPSQHDISVQLQRLHATGFYDKLSAQAAAHGFAPAFFFAIASRETNCVNELGDFQEGVYHGVGIVQIDVQHDLARQARDDGTWRTHPEPLIGFGATLLSDNIRRAREAFPTWSSDAQLKVAASGYNCGMGRAIAAAKDGDSDKRTTGHDYGRDVMARMAIFAALDQPAASVQATAQAPAPIPTPVPTPTPAPPTAPIQ